MKRTGNLAPSVGVLMFTAALVSSSSKSSSELTEPHTHGPHRV
jgi:hypothetical protein